MKTIKIFIKANRGAYSAYAEDVKEIHGEGESIGKTLQSVIDSIRKLKAYTPDKVPDILKDEFKIAIEHL